MKKVILAIDDNPRMLTTCAELLRAHGYRVITARDGEEGLRKLLAGKPDLILLDVKMPELSGWEVLEKIRAREQWRDIPVIMLSAVSEPTEEELDARPGHFGYVTKDTTGDELLSVIREALPDAE
jgi:CheY-like chemotaxis protein